MTREWEAFTWFAASVASAAGVAYLANRIPDKDSVGWRVGAGIVGGVVGFALPLTVSFVAGAPNAQAKPVSGLAGCGCGLR